MYFGADYYPEHRDPEFWGYDLDLMQKANINCLRIAEFAWSRFEAKEDSFTFDWLGNFIRKAAARNIDILMCVPFRTAPAWMVEKEPDILMTTSDGHKLEFGSRYTFCVNHPYFCEREAIIAAKLADYCRGFDNVVGWHLCNEHGDEPDCHCPVCKTKFQAWLREKYRDINHLNQRWGLEFWSLEFNHFEQIPTPALTKTKHNPAHVQNWREFRSECTIEALVLQKEQVQPFLRKNQFITTNNQPLWNFRTDYYKMCDHLDVAGTNYYPPFGDDMRRIAMGLGACRSYRDQKKFLVLELRNGPHMLPFAQETTPQPGEVERLTMHCLTNGANGTFFFRWKACPFGCEQWHGTITGFDGKPKKVYQEVRKTGEKLKRIGDVIDNTIITSGIALLYDFPTRWIMEETWKSPANFSLELSKELYFILNSMNRNLDVLGRYDDLSKYKVLVVPMLSTVEDDLANKLVEYVENGGTLIWHPLSGIKNDDACIYPARIHPVLKDAFGVDIAEFATVPRERPASFTWNGQTYDGNGFCDLPVLESAVAVAEFSADFYQGTPAICRRELSQGQVYYLATFAENNFYRDFFTDLFGKLSISKILDADVPQSVELKEHLDPDSGKRYIFMVSHDASDVAIETDQDFRDIYSNEDISGNILLKSYGSRVLELF